MSQPITKDTFKALSTDSKLNVTFDILQEQCSDIKEIKKSLTNKKFRQKIEGFMGGIIGGILAVLSNKIFWR